MSTALQRFKFTAPNHLPPKTKEILLRKVAKVSGGSIDGECVHHNRRISKKDQDYLRGYMACLGDVTEALQD